MVAPSAGSAPSRSSACGPSCTTPSTSYARPSAAFRAPQTRLGGRAAQAPTPTPGPTSGRSGMIKLDTTSVQETGHCSDLAYGLQTGRDRYVDKSLAALAWLFLA